MGFFRVAICDHLAKLKFAKRLPHAFTEHGAIMAANVRLRADSWQLKAIVKKRGPHTG